MLKILEYLKNFDRAGILVSDARDYLQGISAYTKT